MKISRDNIGVIVVTYRRNAQLIKTLNAILNEGISKAHIWVINNEKTDSLDFLTTDIRFKEINTIHTKKNIASAGGFALGMKNVLESGLSWAWLFNDDSRPIPGSFDSLLAHKEKLEGEKAGLIKLANKNDKGEAVLQNWKGRRVPRYVPISHDLVETDLVTFDACLISVELINAIGTCDPDYFMGTYEFDYCLKAKDHGFKIYTIPNGMIEDEKSGSIGGTPPWRQYYNTRNHLYLGISRKDLGIIWAWMVREGKFTYAIIRYQDRKIERLKMKIMATWHGIKGIRGKVFHD